VADQLDEHRLLLHVLRVLRVDRDGTHVGNHRDVGVAGQRACKVVADEVLHIWGHVLLLVIQQELEKPYVFTGQLFKVCILFVAEELQREY